VRPQIGYKYRIKEKLELLTYEEYKLVMKAFPRALKISQRTFHRYMYTRIHEKYSMPVDHLAQLARFFNCRMEDLLNYDPPPLTSRKICTTKTDLILKLNLKK
jgi:hypothetical protein